MEIILANSSFEDLGMMTEVTLDVDVGDQNDFELTVSRKFYVEHLQTGAIVYSPNTEYGGIIGDLNTDSSLNTLKYNGRTWRGMLKERIIQPPDKEDYRVVSGDVGTIVSDLINLYFPDSIFYAPSETIGKTVNNYKFDRYVTLLDGLNKLLKYVDCRLDISHFYDSTTTPPSSKIRIGVAEIVDHSEELELSQDLQLNFKLKRQTRNPNHLICLGKGDLKEREVIHLYVQEDGSIGYTPFYTGLDEVQAIYDYSNVESYAELIKGGMDELKSLMNKETFEMDIAALNIDIPLSDLVGGRDYLTGLSLIKPIVSKIWRYEDGKSKIDYKIEGDDSSESGRLPSEYQEVEWIESDGKCYINTGITEADDCAISCKFDVLSPAQYDYLFGAAQITGEGSYAYHGLYYYNILEYNYEDFTFEAPYDESFHIELKEVVVNGINRMVVNGTEFNKSIGTSVKTVPMKIFAINNIRYYKGKSRCHYFEMVQGGKTVFYGVPCYRKEDGEIGMYDITGNRFLGNSGTGHFTKGNDV